jgi:hypothetical protein
METITTSLAQTSVADLARPNTGLIRAEDWCAAHSLTPQQTDKIIDLQRRKAVVDLDYSLIVGEMVKEVRQILDGTLTDKCFEEVLGIPRRTAMRYELVYDFKQSVPELNQSSVELIGVVALASMQASRNSYEMSEEEKRAIIAQAEEDQKKITEKAVADLKQALKRDALVEQTRAVDEAVKAAREGDAEALQTLADERRKLKEDMAELLNELRETRAKLPKDATAAQVAEATVNLPEPGSVTDRVTPSLSFLRDDPTGQARVKDTRDPLMNWMVTHRRSLLRAIKDFNEIYDEIQGDYTNRHAAYQLLWEAIDLISPESDKTKWAEAFGKKRSETLSKLSVELHNFANRVKHLPTLTSMGSEPFRVEE